MKAKAPFKPIERTDRVQTVLKEMTDSIVANRFGADGVLPPEGELARSFGVSRTVIREVMRMLQAYELVEVSQGRAARVHPPSPKAVIASLDFMLRRGAQSLHDLMDVRRPLESEIAALAAERATPTQVAELEAAVVALQDARTMEERVAADVRFHQQLALMTGNPIFGILLEVLGGLLQESRRQTIARGGVPAAVGGHRQILSAVRAKDAARARKTMLDHLKLAEQHLR